MLHWGNAKIYPGARLRTFEWPIFGPFCWTCFFGWIPNLDFYTLPRAQPKIIFLILLLWIRGAINNSFVNVGILSSLANIALSWEKSNFYQLLSQCFGPFCKALVNLDKTWDSVRPPLLFGTESQWLEFFLWRLWWILNALNVWSVIPFLSMLSKNNL